MPAVRRLAAILASDVAGYSRLMGADEEGTHERLKVHRRELIDPKIGEHSGRIVKTTGDGMLAEFPSVVDAVRCAAELQRAMIDREAGVPEDRWIRFRVGINLGDVIVEDGDIFGDGVNVAARLEALAEPGGICISRTVRDHIRDKLTYSFDDIGEQSVKNIARPVRVYALHPEAIADLPATDVLPVLPRRRRGVHIARVAMAAAGTAALVIASAAWWLWPAAKPSSPAVAATTIIAQPLQAPRLSIVVLPFANLSNDPDQQYFADGITEDLTTDLSRIANMFVISRNTAFTYQGKRVDTKQIGRDLGVRYVLEGSVQRSGDQVRVSAQLINAETDAHLWAERFDGDAAGLFALQNEITGRIAVALNVELTGAEAARPTEHPDALDYFLRGRAGAASKVATRGTRAEAISMYERALALDPRFAEAQSRLAAALSSRAMDGMADSPAADIARAESLANQALAASPRGPVAHFAKGQVLRAQAQVLREEGRCEEAIAEYRTALSLDRNLVYAMTALGWCKFLTGSMEEAIPRIEQALRLSPRDPAIHNWYQWIGMVHLLQSRTDEAIVWLEKARNANRVHPFIRAQLASAYALKGETERAAAELAEARRLSPDDRFSSLARLKAVGYFRRAENPCVVRSYLFRRSPQGRDTGRMTLKS
jgi:TolB-like protein/class 3 adenylate cyclase/Flp pilus assembly protein TadD